MIYYSVGSVFFYFNINNNKTVKVENQIGKRSRQIREAFVEE